MALMVTMSFLWIVEFLPNFWVNFTFWRKAVGKTPMNGLELAVRAVIGTMYLHCICIVFVLYLYGISKVRVLQQLAVAGLIRI